MPFTVTVDDMATLYIANLRDELRGAAGFNWQNWNAAAQYCLRQDRNLDEALKWAEYASSNPFIGQATQGSSVA